MNMQVYKYLSSLAPALGYSSIRSMYNIEGVIELRAINKVGKEVTVGFTHISLLREFVKNYDEKKPE